VTFSHPVAIKADTVYVVSYQAPNGHHSTTRGDFTQTAPQNGPLEVLRDGEYGPNGVYQFGSGFPTNPLEGSNYWLDIIFETDPPVNPATPAATAAGVQSASR
jgi:hypothetical protein